MDFDKEMLRLHQRVNRNEVIVGWYVRGPVVSILVLLMKNADAA